MQETDHLELEQYQGSGIYIGFLGNAFPIIEGMEGNIVLGAPFLDGKAAGFQFVESGDPLGKISLVKSLFSVHEKPPKFNHSISASCTSRVKIFRPSSHRHTIIKRY